MTLRRTLLCLVLIAAPPAATAQSDDFIDDRSSAARVVTSLYNAIDRGEYLRGWSYFAPGAAPPFERFRDGYADTAQVELRLGPTESDGAAGTLRFSVPVAIRATGRDGSRTVFIGCYALSMVQPANQATPPYRPIRIERGSLQATDTEFATAMGDCPG
ncbi:hypothetical protein SAMN05421538_10975 [Paracoccus isoporae]|uniref:Uncharacterized protein n=1 Tax=Paracoccus isoporae TaxID=591205 RepID=A0A1G7EUH3_9RHOB|nr:hypothetical protein [Paracoccus isoporae]SDE67075.1 hypothetical protein SAMN05421538_10975 [Paracoccus isoporae]